MEKCTLGSHFSPFLSPPLSSSLLDCRFRNRAGGLAVYKAFWKLFSRLSVDFLAARRQGWGISFYFFLPKPMSRGQKKNLNWWQKMEVNSSPPAAASFTAVLKKPMIPRIPCALWHTLPVLAMYFRGRQMADSREARSSPWMRYPPPPVLPASLHLGGAPCMCSTYQPHITLLLLTQYGRSYL